MAHWFHRAPIKATALVNFNEAGSASTPECLRICSMVADSRSKLLKNLTDPRHSVEIVEKEVENYLSLLNGFVMSASTKQSGLSRLRNLNNFKWTQTLLGSKAIQSQDSVFELLNMLVNIGLWYTKHAACVAAANATPSMEEAKQVHKCLRHAAGIFLHVKEFLPNLAIKADDLKHSDLDAQILCSLLYQTQAEAQEVTIARAIEMKHSSSIISALAYETSQLYEKAELDLRPCDPNIVGKWSSYVKIKQYFYLAYAHTFNALELVEKEEAGSALRGLKEAAVLYDKAKEQCKDYAKSKGEVVSSVKPEKHLFFRNLEKTVEGAITRVKAQNDMIFHQKMDFDPPQLELKKETFGLVSPEEWNLPKPHELWTEWNYDSFDHSKAATEKQVESTKQTDEKIKKPDEVPIKQSDQEASNESGCSVM